MPSIVVVHPKTLKRLMRRHLHTVMSTLEGLLCEATASLEACREVEREEPLRNEVVLLTGRLEDARERARGEWGTHFVQLAMEDFRA